MSHESEIIKSAGFEKRLRILLDYMEQKEPGNEFDFLKKLEHKMSLSKNDLTYACFVSVASGDWDKDLKNSKGKATKTILKEIDSEDIRDDELAHEFERNLAKKYKRGELERGNHRKYLYTYAHHSWEFNRREGGAIVSAIRSYMDFLGGKKPASKFREFERKEDPFDSAFKDIQRKIRTFGPLATFDFLQALNYLLDHTFLNPSYIYSRERGEDSGVPRGMKYLLCGDKNKKWKEIREASEASERFGKIVKEVEREVIEATRQDLNWPERKLAFDVESHICNYQKKLEGNENLETAREKVLKKKPGTSC